MMHDESALFQKNQGEHGRQRVGAEGGPRYARHAEGRKAQPSEAEAQIAEHVKQAGGHRHDKRRNDLPCRAKQRSTHLHDVEGGKPDQHDAHHVLRRGPEGIGRLQQREYRAAKRAGKKSEQHGDRHAAAQHQPHIVLRPPPVPRAHGLTDRGHASRAERPAEHHEKDLNLKGQSHGGLHVGRNAAGGPDVGKVHDDAAKKHHHLRPDKSPDGAERHIAQPLAGSDGGTKTEQCGHGQKITEFFLLARGQWPAAAEVLKKDRPALFTFCGAMHAGATDAGGAEQPKTTQPPFSLRRAQRRGFRAYSAFNMRGLAQAPKPGSVPTSEPRPTPAAEEAPRRPRPDACLCAFSRRDAELLA